MYTLKLMLTLSFKQNFVKNSLRVHQERLINQAWDLIMKHAEQVSICWCCVEISLCLTHSV